MVQLSTKIITGHIWRSVGSNLHISAKNLRTSKWSRSVKNGSKHLMLSLSMAYNVIRNHQKYPPKIFALNRNLLNCTWWILLSICRKNQFFSKTHYSRFEFFPIAHGKKWLMWASSIAKIVEDKFFFVIPHIFANGLHFVALNRLQVNKTDPQPIFALVPNA